MKITLDIKDNNYNTFLEFIKTLNYVSLPKENAIPQWQQDIVLERIKNTPKDQYVSWDEIEKNITFD